MAQRKQVVIIGSGYAGMTVAINLEKQKDVEVTIISPTEGFTLHKISLLRASVKGGNWISRSLIPTDKTLTKSNVVRGLVTSINAGDKTVTLDNGKVIKYDTLVIASGGRNFSPGDVPRNIVTKADVTKYIESQKAALTKTQNVVIVGSGAVGLELASEIRESGKPGAKITIVTKSDGILHDGGKYKASGIKKIESDLKKLNIEMIYKDEVASHLLPENSAEASPIVQTPEGVTLKSGKKIPCDLLVFAVGTKLNTEFVPAAWLDKVTKEVIVDQKTLLVTGTKDVFAVGDVAKVDGPKRGYFAGEDGKVVAKNVLQQLQGKEPTNKIQRMSMIILYLGSKGGRTLLPFATFGPWMTTSIKSKDLFVGQFWKTFAPNANKPPKAN